MPDYAEWWWGFRLQSPRIPQLASMSHKAYGAGSQSINLAATRMELTNG
jgi:hypothetical protein